MKYFEIKREAEKNYFTCSLSVSRAYLDLNGFSIAGRISQMPHLKIATVDNNR